MLHREAFPYLEAGGGVGEERRAPSSEGGIQDPAREAARSNNAFTPSA